MFIDSEKGLDSIVQLIHKQDEDADLLIQEYIKTEYDVRVHVLGGKVFASMKRPVIEGDFESNVSQGSKPKKITLTELEIEECLNLLLSGIVCGYWTVDFIPSKNRDKQPPYFLEVNSSILQSIEDATGQNIAKEVITHFVDGENRYT